MHVDQLDNVAAMHVKSLESLLDGESADLRIIAPSITEIVLAVGDTTNVLAAPAVEKGVPDDSEEPRNDGSFVARSFGGSERLYRALLDEIARCIGLARQLERIAEESWQSVHEVLFER